MFTIALNTRERYVKNPLWRYFFLVFTLVPLFLHAQIRGTILDENKAPLPFVSVYLRNTTIGTIANADGAYSLPAAPGDYEVVFQYLGYEQLIKKVKVGPNGARLDAQMKPSELQLQEVVITREDPAVRIMREVIAKRAYFKQKEGSFTCDAYVKGFYKIGDVPKKIFGQETGDMGGILDSASRSGVLYLSESVSKVYHQRDPLRHKEVMVSSKVSGADQGFSFNRAFFTEFDLYNEKIEIEREMLSPLADNAFSYYDFKFKGEIRDPGVNYVVYKIQLLPKRSADPTFGGHIYVVADQWNLSATDLVLTENALKIPGLDSMNIRQEFVRVAEPDTWRMLSQYTGIKFGVFGFNIRGFFNTILSNYELNPNFDNGVFNKEVFRIEKEANKRDSSYWNSIRPIPLTQEESKDYIKKDSLQTIRNSPAYLDSMDRKANKFGLMDIVSGYTWRNSRKHVELEVPGAAKWIQFNTVQGWLVNIEPEFTKSNSDLATRFWKVGGQLNYGFSEERLRGTAFWEQRFESNFFTRLRVEGGVAARQFNAQEPIGPMINGIYSLWLKRNYMKLYEKTYGRVEFGRVLLPGLSVGAAAEFAQRDALENNTDYNLNKKLERAYTSNRPLVNQEPSPEPFFASHEVALFQVQLSYRPGEKYSQMPDFRQYEGSAWPSFSLLYRKAISGVLGSDIAYDYLQVQVQKRELKMGLFGYSNLLLRAGAFLQKERMEFADYHHLRGNRVLVAPTQDHADMFFLAPYYAYSTNSRFVEAHWEHRLQGWLFDKIPGVRKLGLTELIGAKFYQADQYADTPRQQPYWETYVGIDNIGFGPFRALRADFVWNFIGKENQSFGVVLGLGL